MGQLGWRLRMNEFSDFIEKVKSIASLKDAVEGYTKVKKSGSRFVALCPFPDHKEKTPSFFIDENLGLFHCFGCGRGGDIFKFYSLMVGYTFKETLEFLSRKYGIPFPKIEKKGSDFGKYKIEEILKDVLKIYKEELFSENSEGKKYLLNRGFKLEEAKEWELGFAPPEYGFLKEKLKGKYSDEDLLNSGVYAKGDKGYYERFRGRLIFPIYSVNDILIGFAGRILTADLPKYINTQETLSFKKSRVLFGLNRAKKELNKFGYFIIVEGYFDCLRLWQAGFKTAVATMGTALSQEHGMVLKKFTNNLILCFDSDSAGQNAAASALKNLLPFNFKIELIFLEEGEDPDSFVLKKGKGSFDKKFTEKVDFYEFLFKREFFKPPFKFSIMEKSEKIKKIMEYLNLIKDPIIKISYITNLSERVGIPYSTLNKMVISPSTIDIKKEEKPVCDAEKSFFSNYIKNIEVRKKFEKRFHPEIFQNLELKEVARWILEKKVDKNENLPHIIIDEFKEEEELISEILLLPETNSDLEILWKVLQERFLKRKLKEINLSLRNSKEEEKNKLLEEQKEVLKEIKKLKDIERR